MIDAFHFLRPAWLLLWPIMMALLWWRAQRHEHSGSWLKVIDPALQPHVLVDAMGSSRSRFALVSVALAVTLFLLALAGPSWERQSMPAARAGDSMVIALDLSRSMDATDIAPSRLARAKLKLKDILRLRAGGETALIVFSANAFVVTPLTDDAQTIDALVETLSTDLMPSRGSYPEMALAKAQQLLSQAGVAKGRVLLIMDGGNFDASIAAVRELRELGHEVSVLAVGTAQGGPIPLERGGFVTDRNGNIAVVRTDADAMQRLAFAGGGRFAMITDDSRDLTELKVAPSVGAANTQTDQTHEVERWADAGPWFLLLVLPLAALAFRRGALVAVVLCISLPASNAVAMTIDDLWLNKDQQAARALAEGDAEKAAELFRDQKWRAAAKFRAGDFAQSARDYSDASAADDFYNLGTALARAGEFDEAISALEQAIAIDPDHEDAKFNLSQLQQREQQQQDQNASGEQGEQSEDQQQSQSGEQSESTQSGESAQANNEEAPSEGSEQSDAQQKDAEREREQIEELQAQMREREREGTPSEQELTPEQAAAMIDEREQSEREQALEQWLRRVPDDPGGLLRRKFRMQYQRQRTDQDGNELQPDDREQPW